MHDVLSIHSESASVRRPLTLAVEITTPIVAIVSVALPSWSARMGIIAAIYQRVAAHLVYGTCIVR